MEGFRFSGDYSKLIAPGSLLANRYRIESLLGSGGMGTVFKAHDSLLDLPVALKVLNPAIAGTAEAVQRLKHEVILARKFTHPNACRIYDLGESGGTFYVSMEYIEGRRLDQLLHEKGRLSLAEGLAILRQVLSALAEAHRAGVFHRDLKPQNIMLSDSKAYVMDFGISISGDMDRITRTGMIVGTPQYMAPEQFLDGVVDHRTDMYSLGVILYEVFTGRLPFEAKTPASAMYAHVNTPPPDPRVLVPDIPFQLQQIILRTLQKNPEARFSSLDEFLLALERVPAASEKQRPAPLNQNVETMQLPNEARRPPAGAEKTMPASPVSAGRRLQEESPPVVEPQTFERSRPAFLTLLAVLNAVWAFGYFVFFFLNLPEFHHGDDTVAFLAVGLLVVSLHVALCRGIWRLRPWARHLQRVYSSVWFLCCALLVGRKIDAMFYLPFALALSVLIIWYLSRESVEDLFDGNADSAFPNDRALSAFLLLLALLSIFVGGYTIAGSVRSNSAMHDRSRARITYADMRAVAGAVEEYAVDENRYPRAQTIQELAALLEPKYVKKLSQQDAWGTDFRYQVTPDEQQYVIGSAGSDRHWEQSDLFAYSPGKNAGYAEDIILSESGFTRWAEDK